MCWNPGSIEHHHGCHPAGGKAVIVGVFEKPAEINMMLAVFFEKQIIGSFAITLNFQVFFIPERRKNAGQALITAKIKLDDIVERGLKELIHHKEKYIKILVSPNDGENDGLLRSQSPLAPL